MTLYQQTLSENQKTHNKCKQEAFEIPENNEFEETYSQKQSLVAAALLVDAQPAAID